MNLGDFNEESVKPEFIYKKNPLVPHSYQIFQFKTEKDNYEPVGTYNLLDTDEAEELTEKRVMNLIAVMNQRKRMIDLSSLTNARTLYTMVPMKPEDEDQKIIFRTYDGSGVSKENAILVIEKGVFHE
ncbi:MAG: hypothetical protein CMH27_04965 [Micavibrio sp.]|nr:hypothetical protein [Micavibrio sp.]|tara:strand:- start:1212 stop:1595 length:384 start_codon:yes stop_codon:yes gene_type:complete